MNTYHPIGITGLPLPGPVPRTPQLQPAPSYKAFFARRRRDVLTLRALALKGRAKTSDAVLGFVFGLPDGVAWNVLSFWRCHYPVTLPDGEGGRITVLVDC